MVWSLQANNNRGDFSWPKELDRKIYVKANKDSGLEIVLDELAKAEAVWQKQTHPYPPTTTNFKLIDQWETSARNFPKEAAVQKTVTSLAQISKVAATLEKTKVVDVKGKKVKLGSDALTALKTIRVASDAHVKSVTPAVLTPQVEAVNRALRAKAKTEVLSRLKNVVSAFVAVTKKGHPEYAKAKELLTNWPADPQTLAVAQGQLATAIYDGSRDMTQALANLKKALDAGTDPAMIGLQPRHVAAIGTMIPVLVKWGNNGNAAGTVKQMDRTRLIKEVQTVSAQAQLFDQISGVLTTT